jgi:hypothetical protein
MISFFIENYTQIFNKYTSSIKLFSFIFFVISSQIFKTCNLQFINIYDQVNLKLMIKLLFFIIVFFALKEYFLIALKKDFYLRKNF